jgi:hypothetical protein
MSITAKNDGGLSLRLGDKEGAPIDQLGLNEEYLLSCMAIWGSADSEEKYADLMDAILCAGEEIFPHLKDAAGIPLTLTVDG